MKKVVTKPNGRRAIIDYTRREEIIPHLAGIAQQALSITLANYEQREDKTKKPPVDRLLLFVVLIMTSLEIGKPIESILEHPSLHKDKIQGMAELLKMLIVLNEVSLPDGFPYTLQELMPEIPAQ